MKKLEQKIDMDEKMKKMGDMQLSSVNDPKKRKTILDQVIPLVEFNFKLFYQLIIHILKVWEEMRNWKINKEVTSKVYCADISDPEV